MSSTRIALAECAETRWDAIVVGTGMGGATIGYELARLGHRVLFIEKGPFLHAGFPAAPPELAQCIVCSDESDEHTRQAPKASDYLAEGLWPHRAQAKTNLGEMNFRVPVGCASGGSTAFYAAALERFSPDDFEPREKFSHVHGTTLPDEWPVSYQEFVPWYQAAERLFQIRGTDDPLYPGSSSELLEPPTLSARDQQLFDDFEFCGLHPYRIHVGCKFVEGCDGCPAGPCERDCKRDAAWTCLIPALVQHGATILPNCEVTHLEASACAVEEVLCRHEGTELRLQARIIVLAAGAFATPSILLRSRSSFWQKGLGNSSDLVGRNLMFHGGDFIAVSPSVQQDGKGVQKSLALNDFYFVDGKKLGTFQSLGMRLELGQVMRYLRESAEYSNAWWKWLFLPKSNWWQKLVSPLVRLGAMAYFYLRNFKHTAVWVSIVEDLPYWENRLYPDPDSEQDIVIEYQYSDELRDRVSNFRHRLAAALGHRRLMILSPDNKIDFPHASGTCRFGNDESSSVLNRNNRAHEIQNLYVVDASFFPSSAGTNPSLTIAANALRVASEIDNVLRSDPLPDCESVGAKAQ